MLKKVMRQVKHHRQFILFIGLMLVFRSAVADWNHVPSGSMLPTIVQGDRILVNKMAYDLRLPFTHVSLMKLADPERGDIITFDSAKADKKLVKRIIGLPGDTLAMRNNRLYLNGVALNYRAEPLALTDNTEKAFSQRKEALSDGQRAFSVWQEALPGKPHAIRLNDQPSRLANFGPVIVPEGHYLALGDNRDASADSRVIGFVPREEITGKAHRVAFSNDPERYYWFRSERWLLPI
ncbi:signal peptidase I [Shewanella alkalitolerans]|uniref:signal peptidase I n=1 Tax=Shewanella alkalitolerans TaxID=2864209 RepID=UPI001C65CE76|nr:signal peptidase I [Shewanella alkalitolerans]QYJ98021.1 signal peptidase I [Shewanella alkalitolerans]